MQYLLYRDCLRAHILNFRDADVLCPCNEGFNCKDSVTEQEMRAVSKIFNADNNV